MRLETRFSCSSHKPTKTFFVNIFFPFRLVFFCVPVVFPVPLPSFFFSPSLLLSSSFTSHHSHNRKMTTRTHKASASTSGMLSVRPLDPKKLEPFQNGAAPPPLFVVRTKRPSDSSSVVVPVQQATQNTLQRQSRSATELTPKSPREPAKPAAKPEAKPEPKSPAKPSPKPAVVVGTPPAKTLSPLSKPPSPPKKSAAASGTTAQSQSQAQTLLNGHYVCTLLTPPPCAF